MRLAQKTRDYKGSNNSEILFISLHMLECLENALVMFLSSFLQVRVLKTSSFPSEIWDFISSHDFNSGTLWKTVCVAKFTTHGSWQNCVFHIPCSKMSRNNSSFHWASSSYTSYINCFSWGSDTRNLSLEQTFARLGFMSNVKIQSCSCIRSDVAPPCTRFWTVYSVSSSNHSSFVADTKSPLWMKCPLWAAGSLALQLFIQEWEWTPKYLLKAVEKPQSSTWNVSSLGSATLLWASTIIWEVLISHSILQGPHKPLAYFREATPFWNPYLNNSRSQWYLITTTIQLAVL